MLHRSVRLVGATKIGHWIEVTSWRARCQPKLEPFSSPRIALSAHEQITPRQHAASRRSPRINIRLTGDDTVVVAAGTMAAAETATASVGSANGGGNGPRHSNGSRNCSGGDGCSTLKQSPRPPTPDVTAARAPIIRAVVRIVRPS